MSRIPGAFLLVTMICLASDCHAQRHRGVFARGAQVLFGTRHNEPRNYQEQFSNNGFSPDYRFPATPRYDDWRNSTFYDAAERYPKYIGGFHSSHFNNLGVPHGDIGFRGNSIFWNPW